MVLIAGCTWSTAGVVIRFIDDTNEWKILLYRSITLSFTLFYFISFRQQGPLIKAYTDPGFGAVIGGFCLACAFAC